MQKLKTLIDLVRPYYPGNDNAHDFAHIGRVAATAKKLCEGHSVEVENVLAAVYCHDLVNLPKNHPDRDKASELAAQAAEPLLRQTGFDDKNIEVIKQAILEHSFSRGLRPSVLEGAILQDADRLDGLGAIGILRCASVNSQMQGLFYDPFDPLAENRPLDDKAFMLDHYWTKLFKLPEMMNTENGKKMAEERVEFMKGFVEQLLKEAGHSGSKVFRN